MTSKKINHVLNEEKSNKQSKETQKKKSSSKEKELKLELQSYQGVVQYKKRNAGKEKYVKGVVVELNSYKGVVEYSIQGEKEQISFFKHKLLVNGKKADKRTNLLNIMQLGTKVKLKIAICNNADGTLHSKLLQVEYESAKALKESPSTSYSSLTEFVTHLNQELFQQSNRPWKAKPPYIDAIVCTVVSFLSDFTGILLSDPVEDDGCCKVLFETEHLFTNGYACESQPLMFSLCLGQTVHCTATKISDYKDIEYKAVAVWIGQQPILPVIIARNIPIVKMKDLTPGTECIGTVTLLVPPKTALLILDSDNYAVLFMQNIKCDEATWIGDIVQIGDRLVVKVDGHYHNLCFAVSEAWKVKDSLQNNLDEQIHRTAETFQEQKVDNTSNLVLPCKSSSSSSFSESHFDSELHSDTPHQSNALEGQAPEPSGSKHSRDKSLEIGCDQNIDGSKELSKIQNGASSTSDNAASNGTRDKPCSSSKSCSLSEQSSFQAITKNLCGRTGKVIEYRSESTGVLCDPKISYVTFNKSAVEFPLEIDNVDLRKYLPVGSTVYYNLYIDEKKGIYLCSKIWASKKQKIQYFKSISPNVLKGSSTSLCGENTYEAVIFKQQIHGLFATVATAKQEVHIFVPLCNLQLYPDGPFIGGECSAYVKVGDVVFVKVYYNYVRDKKRTNWIASKAWVTRSRADFIGTEAVAQSKKTDGTSVINGKLTAVTSDWGEIHHESGKSVFFNKRNAFLFEVNLSQMDLQKVFVKGEILQYNLSEDEMCTEAAKAWFGSLDPKATINQRIDAILDYWMERDLDKPTLRAVIKELKRQHADQDLQIPLKETVQDVINTSYICTKGNDSGLKADTEAEEEESQNKAAALDISETKDMTPYEPTVHAESVTNIMPFALNPLCIAFCANQSDESLSVSRTCFESKQLFVNLKQKVLQSLLYFLEAGKTHPTVLQNTEILLKSILQEYDSKEIPRKLAFSLLKQMGIDFPKDIMYKEQLNATEDKPNMTNLYHLENIVEIFQKSQHQLKSHEECNVESAGSNIEDVDSYSAEGLVIDESNDVSEVIVQESLTMETESTNSTEQKEYANKEVQTISTGEILYSKVVTDV